MPANNPHTTVYSAADLLRYATGRMTAPEMHAVEKAALEDPFLAEALEGYMEAAGVQSHPVLQTNINKLTPLTEQQAERKTIPLWRKKAFQYAAAAVLILGGGWATYSLLNPANNEQQSVASAPVEKQIETASADTVNMNSPATSSDTGNKPVQQVPAEAERDAYANVETNEAPPDLALQRPLQQSNAIPQKQTMVQDTVAMNRADNTSVDMDDVAKKEMKDASSPAPVLKPPPAAPDEMASEFKPVQRQQSGTLARAKSRTEAEPRNVFRGRITDTKNNPLPYANVMISGENVGTYTDSKGIFNITYDDSVLPVRTRSLGYESQTVQLKPGSREQQIIMPEDEKLKESLAVVMQKPQAKQAGLKPLIIETDSLSSAQPVVGLIDYNTYLLNNNRISQLPLASRSVELSFEVDKRGEVKNITVEQSSGKELDAEAIRLLKEGPKWKANKSNSRARVKVKL